MQLKRLLAHQNIMLCQEERKELVQLLQEELQLFQHQVQLLCTKFITMLDL